MDSNRKAIITQIENHKKSLLTNEVDISLTNILSTEACQKIISESREYRERSYSPLKTIFTFIKQILSPDKSCKKAVLGIIADQVVSGEKENSSNTGPYCKARQRLPEEMIKELVKEVGQIRIEKIPSGWKIYGREPKLIDGSIISMPDTEENQAVFPQHGNQKAGAGFPLARIAVVMSLSAGTVIDYAADAYKGKGTGEHSLFRSISDSIKKNFGGRVFTYGL